MVASQRSLGQEALHASDAIEPAVDPSLVDAASAVDSIRSAVSCESIRTPTPQLVATRIADKPVVSSIAPHAVPSAVAPNDKRSQPPRLRRWRAAVRFDDVSLDTAVQSLPSGEEHVQLPSRLGLIRSAWDGDFELM
jgi:hypothetical protein